MIKCPPPMPPAGTVYTTVVPYSFFRVSEMAGYGAGNRAPQFYQSCFELTAASRALRHRVGAWHRRVAADAQARRAALDRRCDLRHASRRDAGPSAWPVASDARRHSRCAGHLLLQGQPRRRGGEAAGSTGRGRHRHEDRQGDIGARPIADRERFPFATRRSRPRRGDGQREETRGQARQARAARGPPIGVSASA